MWPWGHAAFGYVCYSLTLRASGRRMTGPEALVIAFATQFPDLVDKPLAWGFDVVSSGYAVGHSVLVAVPLGVAVVALAIRYDRPRLGLAFLFGHLSHIAGDVLVAVAFSGTYTYERVLWPVVTLPGSHSSLSLLEQVQYYGREFLAYLAATDTLAPVLVFVLPTLVAVVLWIADGVPGPRTVHRALAAMADAATRN